MSVEPLPMTLLSDSARGDQDSQASRRTELAAFLRSRRERITPDEVGLPAGGRRRTPGLRREEVAQLAAVGVSWYTWLEQAREINVSVHVMDSIARALRLDRAEREHLYLLAGMPVAVPPPPARFEVTPDLQAILDGMPDLPASVMTERMDVLAHNDAYRAMWPLAATLASYENNLLWHTFVTPPCCLTIVNQEAEVPDLVGRFRAAYASHVGEPAWEDLVSQLSAVSDLFARLWSERVVAMPSNRVKTFRHPAVGTVTLRGTALNVAAAPGLRISVSVPVDAESRSRLDWLIAHPDAPWHDHVHTASHAAR